jgi:ABC-type glycerol-3-phosphate transport system permease component
MQSISDDLIDAAKIDGASEWQVVWRIGVPLSKPAIGAKAKIASARSLF